MQKTAKHRKLPFNITFDEPTHVYLDNEGSDYISVTTVVNRFFPVFDSAGAAARVSKREGISIPKVLARWDAKRDASCEYGTAVHNYAENVVKKRRNPKPISAPMSMAYDAVDEALRMISVHYEVLGSECIVFDPLYRVSGTIDLPLRHRETGRYCIADWKTNEAIDLTPRFPGMGLPPISHIPDCNGNHYRIQFALYAQIMRATGYVPADTEFSNAIIYIPPNTGRPVWIPVEDAPVEAAAILDAWESDFFSVENMRSGISVSKHLEAA